LVELFKKKKENGFVCYTRQLYPDTSTKKDEQAAIIANTNETSVS